LIATPPLLGLFFHYPISIISLQRSVLLQTRRSLFLLDVHHHPAARPTPPQSWSAPTGANPAAPPRRTPTANPPTMATTPPLLWPLSPPPSHPRSPLPARAGALPPLTRRHCRRLSYPFGLRHVYRACRARRPRTPGHGLPPPPRTYFQR
jgi:hypothetical protein